ncbi:MAG: excisionase family DNA-binding protein [Microlunatus sp.]|nr:excisionase family DNA-binding protein [Microlunatus sp.]
MSTLTERTILPEQGSAYETLEAILDSDSPITVEGAGGRVMLPDSVRASLREVIETLRNGEAVSITPIETLLTTQEAAELLGISRPTLIKLLDDKHIEYIRPGRHRRIRLEELLRYQRELKQNRRRVLDDMLADDGQLSEEQLGGGFRATR